MTRESLLRDISRRERLVALDPADPRRAIGLACACNRLARLIQRPDPAEARAWFVRALEIRERLVELAPEDRNARRRLAGSCATLGLLDGRRDPVRGRAWYLRSLALREQLVELEPGNADDLFDLALARYGLARMEDHLDPRKAMPGYEQWLEGVESCDALQPGDLSFGIWKALALEDVGRAKERRSLAGAEEAFRRAIETWRDLVSHSPADGARQEGLARSCHLLGAFLLRSGRAVEEVPLRKEMSRTLRRARTLLGVDGQSEYLRACIFAARGARSRALVALERAVALGFDDSEELLVSLDLASVRGTDRFRRAFEAIPGGSPEASG